QVILQHDNAQPHIVKGTKDIICPSGWEILSHANYSPDLALSDLIPILIVATLPG
ncbi:hypothetical protein X777_04807, partial [Ooceraea biroi]